MLSTDLPWPSDVHTLRKYAGIAIGHGQSGAAPRCDGSVVSARAADGRTGQVARRLSFDPGEYRDLPVVIEGLPETDASVQVRAETRIYDWRQRAFYATATDGQATLSVEGLFHVDLGYSVSMVPQIIDGTRYITVPESILLPRGENVEQPVVLTARPIRGALDGRLVDANTGGGLQADALLVNLSGGQSHALDVAADGSFALDDLDMDAYVIQAQADGYFHLPYHVDLTEALPKDVRVHLIPGGAGGEAVSGGQPLPFAKPE